VRELGDGDYLVVEGNRRVAALKQLARQYDEKGIELGQLDSSIFRYLPVVLYEDAGELHHLKLMALKHISGNKKWGEWNQAKLLETMSKEYGCSADEIVHSIGISKVELRRSLRALALVGQYLASDYDDISRRWHHFCLVALSGLLRLLEVRLRARRLGPSAHSAPLRLCGEFLHHLLKNPI
jgi:hypothetical protein